MDATPERAEVALEVLRNGMDRFIREGFSKDTCRYAYGQYTGALFLAYSLGLLDKAEHDRRFHETQKAYYDATEVRRHE